MYHLAKENGLNEATQHCWVRLEFSPRLPDAHEVHCGHLYMLVEMFLNHGLAPNYVFDEDTVLSAVSYVDYQYAAADITRLLLQHGCDPNLKIIDESALTS